MPTSKSKRMAKMVSRETAELISEVAEIIRMELQLDRRLSDNDAIKRVVIEAIERRQKEKDHS